MLRDYAPVSRSRHSWQHGGEASIASENFEHQETFVRTGRGSQIICHLDSAGDSGAEAHAVVSSRHIVVHGFGNRNHLDPLLIQANAVAQSVVPANGYEEIDS